jgi:hypothetical protein
MALRRAQPDTERDLADPVRQQWGHESAVGQYLMVSRETLRLLDMICWQRRTPNVLISVPELVTEFGRQLAALVTLAIYLGEFAGVTPDRLAASYEAACQVGLHE